MGCKQAACPVATEGRCLEGLEPQKCPHFAEIIVRENGGIVKDEPSELVPKTITLPTGLEIPLAEAGELLAAPHTRVIVIAGDNNAGKTTIVVSLFDRYCVGQFGGYLFAGSSSLVAIDRRAHTGYTRSENTVADTAHTAHSWDLLFLHLRLREEACLLPTRDLLLSDIPGETCKRARDSASECAKLGVLCRADRLLLAIDGEKLSDARFRESCISDAINLFRRLAETNVLRPRTPVDFVVTKWDMIAARNSEESVRTAIDRMKSNVARLPVARDFILQWRETAARPESIERFQHCHGMDDFPRVWCDAALAPSFGRNLLSQSAVLDMDKFTFPETFCGDDRS